MMDAQRKLLDQLMGVDRNLNMDDRPTRKRTWRDDSTCKYYICGFCPHDLFANTKSDLGVCEDIHDAKLKAAFIAEDAEARRPYQNRFVRFLNSLIDDLDRKIRRGNDRIQLTGPHGANKAADDEELKKAKMIKDLTAHIEQLLKQMEELGEVGKVDESQGLLKLVEQLQKEKHDLLMAEVASKSQTSQEKRMKVCEVCGAFLVINDAESRVQSHLEGKQHMGYKKIRDALEEFQKKRDGDRSRRSRSRSPRRKRSRSRSSSRNVRVQHTELPQFRKGILFYRELIANHHQFHQIAG
eukprot:TRINITY_DN308_c0_g3_i2.p1 TRINITY_DN308_c0_g3~~TRINITY_DN308_c0_g3_i2.p1  ORF type:complete len:333 (+),score=116.51 TRINITY_DN308_c0_g3_i2:111-1001(+)